MKKYIRIFIIPALVLLFVFIWVSTFADSPSPPPLPGEHGGGGNVAAPIDGGLGLLLVMGLGYAGKKLFQSRNKKNPTEQE
jgi:hypothetical protein